MTQKNIQKKAKIPSVGVILNALGLGYLYAGKFERFVIFLVLQGLAVPMGDVIFGSSNNWLSRIIVIIAMIDVYYIIIKYNKSIE